MQDPTETHQPTLHLICGRIASGKFTLATELGRRDGTVAIREDDCLSGLYGDEMATIADYLRCAARLCEVIGQHVVALPNAGVSMVFDFQANSKATSLQTPLPVA